jgi:excisionase family DNA binding protein
MKEQEMQNGEERAGWRINEWAGQTGLSVATIYRMMERGELRAAKVGHARIILESPREFLERHAPACEK